MRTERSGVTRGERDRESKRELMKDDVAIRRCGDQDDTQLEGLQRVTVIEERELKEQTRQWKGRKPILMGAWLILLMR